MTPRELANARPSPIGPRLRRWGYMLAAAAFYAAVGYAAWCAAAWLLPIRGGI